MLSILLATLTVLPQMSYCGFRAPITPAITGPWLIPRVAFAVVRSLRLCLRLPPQGESVPPTHRRKHQRNWRKEGVAS